MAVGMRKAIVAALTLLCMAESMVVVRTVRLAPKPRALRDYLRPARCLNYMESCVPWEDHCCGGKKCVNYGKGFCMHGLEPCVCQLAAEADLS